MSAFPFARVFCPPGFVWAVSVRVAGSGRAVFGVRLSFCACFHMIIYPCGDTHRGSGIWGGWVWIGVAQAEAARAVSGGWGMGVKVNAAS